VHHRRRKKIEAEAKQLHAAQTVDLALCITGEGRKLKQKQSNCMQPRLLTSLCALQEKEENKKLKQKQRDRMQPKVGKLDIDYQVLHDAFFKHQTKPNLTRLGEIYYEGKEFEARVRADALSCG